MRLDHLLSKEHLKSSGFQNPDQSECLCRELMGGTFDGVSGIEPRVSTAFGSGTFGGSESAHARCWVLRDRMETFVPLGLSLPMFVGGDGYRPYFENYTVDASIFEMSNHLVKMILKIISQFRLTIQTHVISSL